MNYMCISARQAPSGLLGTLNSACFCSLWWRGTQSLAKPGRKGSSSRLRPPWPHSIAQHKWCLVSNALLEKPCNTQEVYDTWFTYRSTSNSPVGTQANHNAMPRSAHIPSGRDVKEETALTWIKPRCKHWLGGWLTKAGRNWGSGL